MNSMNIIDVQQLHQEFPQTFEIPSQDKLDALEPDDLVKICVDNERFYVRVETVEDQKVTGRIYSDMLHTQYHGLSAGDNIEFEKKHIYKIND